MSTLDNFSFLQKKKFVVILISFLLFISISQVALEQSKGFKRTEAFFSVNSNLLKSIGIFLPILIAVILFVYGRTSKGGRGYWIIPRKYILIFLLASLYFLALSSLTEIMEDEEEEPIVDPGNQTTMITTSPSETTTGDDETTNPPTADTNLNNPNILLSFMDEVRNVLILSLIVFPLFLLFLIRQKPGIEEIMLKSDDQGIKEIQPLEYKTQTIIECYYQASDILEERGANDSQNLTPTEFSSDVISKDLSSPSEIDGLTDLFEEAKFSTHELTLDHVKKAKRFALDIIDSPESLQEPKSEKEE